MVVGLDKAIQQVHGLFVHLFFFFFFLFLSFVKSDRGHGISDAQRLDQCSDVASFLVDLKDLLVRTSNQ